MSEESPSPQSPPPAHGGSRMRWQPPTAGELHAQLPQYEILEILGIGGMGAVYKGFQTSLERYVAIKILPPSFSDEDLHYAQRFKQEAKTMARLSHPGIVGVHDCGETPQGLLFIVMEFVEGTDVHRMIHAQGHLPADQAMAILMHVCDALAYAHQNGIIHRDIKPANIMVDTQGRVKVADFGLAKAVAANTGLSSSNLTMGTPDYVAPEALMMGVEVDLRADIYSLGVTLYEMLTGKVPRGRFEAASVRVPGLDPRFDQVVDRAMRDDREARYASAQALRDDLIKIHTVPLSQSGMRSAAARVGPRGPARRPAVAVPEPVESGPPVVLIGLVILAVLGLGLFFWKPWAAKESGTDVASEPAKVASADTSSPPPAPEVAVTRPSAKEPSKSNRTSPAPVTLPKPAPAPPSEADLRLATLDQQFQAAIVRDVEPSFKTGVATLNKGYLGALEQAMTSATQGGKLDDALALRDEKQRLEKGGSVPAEESESGASGNVPGALKDLRKKYRTAYTGIDQDRIKALQPLYDKYDQALANYQADLTKADQVEDAAHVKTVREIMARLRSSGVTSLVGEAGQTVVFNSRVTLPANDPNGFRIGPLKRGDHVILAYQSGYWKGHGRIATVNPDHLTNDGNESDQLAIARATENDVPGPLVALVPTGTATKPYTYIVPADDASLVLRINGSGDIKNNPGKVVYQLKISRSGGAESGSPAAAAPAFTNSLGMRFVAVPGTQILMCIHETRRKDYVAFVAENPGGDDAWKHPNLTALPVSERDDDPVVSVSWDDARAFCAWLSKKEGRSCRLPTDHEWSMAVGIGAREDAGATPESLNHKIKDEYPWGNQWPPPQGAGNYADLSFKKQFPTSDIKDLNGYTDGHITTAPVMSFTPNKLGIYDLGGNAWEWCEDWFDGRHETRVLRGASWVDSSRESMFSSRRFNLKPDTRSKYSGFRCVVTATPGASSAASVPPPANAPKTDPAGADLSRSSPPGPSFTNTLGMKFVAVPGTKILMCIHETRKGDYAAYAARNPDVNALWKTPRDHDVPVSSGNDHPVVAVNWDDAKAFCEWLSKKEGRVYRLPTDHEWSLAAGIGEQEDENATPEKLSSKIRDQYPWGNEWPPPKGAANLADTVFKEKFPQEASIDGYADGFVTTSPVMSFAPNRLGIYDLSGNVWEWCEDQYSEKDTGRVLRGGSWYVSDKARLLSSFRSRNGPGIRYSHGGFRCVLLAP